jgi:tRNA(Glu) U13 pseudouridine synthase TruD
MLTRAGFFIKDPLPADRPLFRGKLNGNRFRIRVTTQGMTADQILQYLANPLELLTNKRDLKFPNFYGRQRLGQRQNLVSIGHAFITKGAEAAIKLFLTQTSPNENAATTQVRKLLAVDWDRAEAKSRENGQPVAAQWPYWHGMKMELDKHRTLNLAVEKAIVDLTLEHCNFEEVIQIIDRELKSGPSLWIGAYQSFWFNQALAKHIRREINVGHGVPLFMRDPAVEKWYRKHGLHEAIPESVDEFVARQFLTPRPPKRPRQHFDNGRNGRRRFPQRPAFEFGGPFRPALIPLQYLSYHAEDGVLNISFMLRSGGYATTFLGMLFNLDQDDKVLSDERISY